MIFILYYEVLVVVYIYVYEPYKTVEAAETR